MIILAPSQRAIPIKELINLHKWEALPHAAYSPDLAVSDCHLFSSMAHALAAQCLHLYENMKKWIGDWFSGLEESCFW